MFQRMLSIYGEWRSCVKEIRKRFVFRNLKCLLLFHSYVVSFIIQFQFHKGACIKAGEYETGNPQKLLSDCDIYQSAAAGNALK